MKSDQHLFALAPVVVSVFVFVFVQMCMQESIRKRVVRGTNTDEILLDETVDQPDAETNWVRPLPCVDGTRKAGIH